MTTNRRPIELAPDPNDPLDLNRNPTKSAARTCRYLWDARVDLSAGLQNLRTVEGNLHREAATWPTGEATADAHKVTALIETMTAVFDEIDALYDKHDEFRRARADMAERGVA